MSISAFALFLVIASSLGWAGFDLLRKLLVRDVAPVALVFLLTVGSAPLFAVWVAVEGFSRPGPGYLAPALGSVLLNVAANLLFLQGMRMAPLSVSVPLLSLTPVFATLMAVPILGEQPAPADVVGILMVIAGAIWLNWPQRLEASLPGEEPAETPVDRRRALAGAAMVAGTSLLWSLATPLDKLALARATAPFHGLVLNGGVAVAVLVVLMVQGGLGQVAVVRRVPGLLVLALVVSSMALGLQLLALPKVFVGTIETLKRGIGNCMALVSGSIFFGERVTLPKVLAVALMAAGVGALLT